MMNSQKNMMRADGWGDDDDTPQENWDYDDGLGMDDYEATEAPETEDIQHAEDVHAAEEEVAHAVRNGDADAADDAMAMLAGLTFTTKPKKRKTKWTPPPQVGLVPKGIEGVFKPTTATWKKPRKTRWAHKIDKSSPTPAEALVKSTKPTDADDDIMRLASLRRGSRKMPVKIAPQRIQQAPAAWKVGATPYRKSRFEAARTREQTGEKISARQQQARDRNHARSEGFARAASGSQAAVRTRICRSVIDGTVCPHGDKCRFAHTPEQLTCRPCNWGVHCKKKHCGCHFPHTPEEIDAATARLRANFQKMLDDRRA